MRLPIIQTGEARRKVTQCGKFIYFPVFLEELIQQLQKVSAAVELNKPAPTQVADNR